MLVTLGSLVFLFMHRHDSINRPPHVRRWLHWVCLALAGPFLAVGIGQLLRQDFYPPNLDAPLRLVFGVPIFLAVSRGWLSSPEKTRIPELWLKWVFPLTLLWTLADTPSWTTDWGAERIVTYFVDPLSFGSLSLLLALLCLCATSLTWHTATWAARLLGLAGFVCGMFLSVKSGSRTGWLMLPFFLWIWLQFVLAPRYGARRACGLLLAPVICGIVLFFTHPQLTNKFIYGLHEILAYRWHDMNPDASVTLRISMHRMALYYFAQNPWSGWGEHGWLAIADTPYFKTFASDFAIHQQPLAGFHNEVLTSAVRSGVWGLLSSLAFFLVPFTLSLQFLRRAINDNVKLIALGTLVYITHLFMAAQGTEVNNLVFLASFNGLSLAVLLGSLFATQSASNEFVASNRT